MKLYIIFLIGLVSIETVAGQASTPLPIYDHKKITAEKAMSMIRALPEVKNFMHYARKDKPMLKLEREPDSTNRYYIVALGVSNFDMFRTSDDYFVDPRSGRIFISDNMDNSTDAIYHLIPLYQWRYWRKDSRFTNYHTIKHNKLIVLDKNGKVIK